MSDPLRPIVIEIINEAAPLPEEEGGGLVYLDTSALVKLYIEEAYSSVVERAVSEAASVVVSEIADLEARVALARLRHEDEISEADLDLALTQLGDDLASVDLIPYDLSLARSAGALAREHGSPPLRAYDALHLASALEAFRTRSKPESGYYCRFLAFDRRLANAARAEGLRLYFDPFLSG